MPGLKAQSPTLLHRAEAAPKAKPRRRPRGQAMVEYSIINWLLVVGLVLGLTVKMFPDPASGDKRNVVELVLRAYQSYYDSLYYVLNLPFP